MSDSSYRNLQQSLTDLSGLMHHAPIAIPHAQADAPQGAGDAGGRGWSMQQTLHAISAASSPDWLPHASLEAQWSEAIHRAQAMVESPACPVVAVLGMLNAGKSSLVATFLSESRSSAPETPASTSRRVLIGSANAEGTHRFVLWLPESWKQDTVIWGFLSQQIRSLFGCDGELLSDDPEVATKQYNAIAPQAITDLHGQAVVRSPIEIPLVATDPQLDRLGIALMDCPDVQTGLMNRGLEIPRQNARFDEASASVAQARFDVLQRASALCSAFLIVLPANAMHDQTVSKLLHMLETRMPHVQRLLAVNRVPRKYNTSEIRREIEQLYHFAKLRRIYMAYNFDGPNHRERLPDPPADFPIAAQPPLPVFFRIDREVEIQPPAPIPDEDWLLRLGEQLEGNALLADAIRSATTTLSVQTSKSLEIAKDWIHWQNRRCSDIHQVIADACLDFSIDPNSPPSHPKLRLQASRAIVQQLAASLESTAPWWAKPGRWVQRIATASKESVSNATSWLKMPNWMLESGNAVGQWLRGRLHRGETGRVITADSLCDHLASRDSQGILNLDDSPERREAVRAACQRAIDRFQSESNTELDQTQIDSLTRKLWADMPMSKRVMSGLAPAGILFAPLLAVIMVPLDFGGSAVLVFASLKELLFAGAAGVGLVLASADSMPHLAESESAWQQWVDLVAILTDELGLQRPEADRAITVQLGNMARTLSNSSIAAKRCIDRDVPGSELLNLNWNHDTEQSIRQCLISMEGALRS